jgi:DNA-binding MarR family transcriptional regulator
MDQPNGPITSLEYEALAAFRYQIRRYLRASEDAVRRSGIEPAQHQFLLALKGAARQQSVTISDLAERLQLQHHSVVGLVNRLVGRKLIERRRGEHDRRHVCIHLTARGEALLASLTLYHRAELQAAGPALVEALNALINSAPHSAPIGDKSASAGNM